MFNKILFACLMDKEEMVQQETRQEVLAGDADNPETLKTASYHQSAARSAFCSGIKPKILIIATLIFISSLAGVLIGLFAASQGVGGFLPKIGQGIGGQQKYSIESTKVVEEDSAIVNIAENSSPAVVSIIISKEVPNYQNFMPFGFGFPFDPFGDNGGNSSSQNRQGSQKQQVGGGTGFLVSEDGMIVTNKHVVSDLKAEYTVMTSDGKEYSAKVLARDPYQDIAIVKVEGSGFPVLNLGESGSLKIGQTVVAIGNSLGEFSNTVSRGIISGLKRNLTAGNSSGSQNERLSNIIQTDAAINPGNSGGPLIDINGNVIGVNVAMAQGAQNIGFALPIDQVKKDIAQVSASGKISTPFLGVRYIPIDKTVQEENNLSFDYGVMVQRGQKLSDLAVIPGSPADKAGIVENDIILEVNGEKVDSKNQLPDLVSKYNIGDAITLKISHKGETRDIKVVLEERK